ncbi:hypothetical protein [Paenibacillus larvae]|uniref:hypothetical protein n=1 Tax=Paenibacillus larvae TaxID=1464 RepID=UPI0028539E05|nr:hypothetical protein [Paenibacillus larvae]MDR5608826.1 hypothetical protein [Paenibacillus larvae]
MTWINTTSAFSLVHGVLNKLTPACIGNALGQVTILDHPLHIENFKGNKAVTIHQLSNPYQVGFRNMGVLQSETSTRGQDHDLYATLYMILEFH